MPNWCYTDITISRPANRGGMQELYDALLEATKHESTIKSDFGPMWLGNLVEKLLDTDPLDCDKYRCRGILTQFEINEDADEISIGTETAWGPMLKMWIDIIEKYVPSAKLIYVTEEPGWEVYQTNDPEFQNSYYVDSWSENVESEYIASEDYVRRIASTLSGKDCNKIADIDSVLQMVAELENPNVSIHKWDYSEDLSKAV